MNSNKRANVFFIAAVVSYFPAWFYVHEIVCSNTWNRGMLIFSVLFIGLTELWCYSVNQKGSGESLLWAVLYILQSIALYLLGFQEVIGAVQILCWHLSAVYYVLARCGGLSENHTGRMLFFDLLSGIFILPWKNIFLRITSIIHGIGGLHQNLRKTAEILITAIVTVLCLLFAVSQLSQANTVFAEIADSVAEWLSSFIRMENVLCFLFSLPVGMWLFGLIGGTLNRKDPVFSVQRTDQWTDSHQMHSSLPASVLLSVLIAVYMLFFVLSLQEFIHASVSGLSAHAASSYAVNGFYELCNMQIFNTLILSLIRHFTKASAEKPFLKTAYVLFSLCSILFALLDFGKLYAYIHLYGFTERRFTAFFALIWLLGVSVLVLIHLYREVNVKRIAFLTLMIGFTALSFLNIEQTVRVLNEKCMVNGNTSDSYAEVTEKSMRISEKFTVQEDA